jgi:hypothetical protein
VSERRRDDCLAGGESKAVIGRTIWGAMPAPVPYFDLVREMKNAFNYRLQLVSYARQHGIKAGAYPNRHK